MVKNNIILYVLYYTVIIVILIGVLKCVIL